ncbi:MAG: tail fiber domain-containing protein, partial [Candidatus Gastranaerophilales bacterium]|nr:tail fiber domain-containing protein [Candidatus Gastranaerophilales bacterium]
VYGFYGFDGIKRTEKSNGQCSGCKTRAFKDVRPNCICTGINASRNNTEYGPGSNLGVSTSYDWTSAINTTNCIGNCNGNGSNCGGNSSGAVYTDRSFNKTISLEHRPDHGETGLKGTDKPLAHMGNSCCPNLLSDVRLKNVGKAFTGGLDEIRKINIYNFTYKNDVNNLPQVGVIAQDLKLIFPTAVSKDSKGYYKIRWDEMLYAAINSIKTLNSKVEKLAARIVSDKNRVAVLKKDNAELNAKLDKLAEELTVLEAKKHKK